jgi:hypothetical protein
MQCFGRRSASGESGAEGGEKRLANRSGSVTPAAGPQTEARRFCGPRRCELVTSARFAERNGRGREGDRADRQPVERSQTVRWSRRANPSLM